ncbi:LGFP repeat-containing protein [Mycobacterium sp.]|uniref:LGFP repeat-containing protein n=1 Tax=Mycobacterium sp. TaxID=1785 RepID=UPI003C7536D3
MNEQRRRLSGLIGRALISVATTAVAAALLAPVAPASPIGDAENAIMAAWEKAGGESSVLGARKGDVYPVGDGFVLDFAGGKFFYTSDTGARLIYGPVLDKYEQLGGPVGSGLGFPTIDEVPGLAGPDSRVSTFSASDKPVIFWTSDHGAFVVSGALNAAWDKLGSSGGVLGVPVGDESYDGDVVSQKFSGGAVSWNRKTKQFTTEPAALAEQLKGLQVAIDPAAAITMAWRAAGGAAGPLGAKQGGQYPIGGDGIAQNFAGGKVYFSPATGANAVESDILAKYESLGGPAGSDLGFPIASESEGGIGSSSRICTFSGADNPVIFWTSEHGAFVVRGAMKAAWDKLHGPTGKLGAPVGDQAVDGNVVSQTFTGGKISWNRVENTFSTDPPNLASSLSGLQISGQHQPSTVATPQPGKRFTFHWELLVALGVALLLVVAVVREARGLRRRRIGADSAVAEPDGDVDGGYDAAVDRRWGPEDTDVAAEHFPAGELPAAQHQPSPDAGSATRVSWQRGAVAADVGPAGAYGGAMPGSAEQLGIDEENPDVVDTDSIPVISEDVLSEAGYPYFEAGQPETAQEAGYPDVDYEDEGYPDVAYSDAAAAEIVAPDAYLSDTDDWDAGEEPRSGRHAAIHAEDLAETGPEATHAAPAPAAGRPTIHLPLEDPYQPPDGYPIKASARFGLYYTPDSELYHDTLAEIWLSSEEAAQANGFVKAD